MANKDKPAPKLPAQQLAILGTFFTSLVEEHGVLYSVYTDGTETRGWPLRRR